MAEITALLLDIDILDPLDASIVKRISHYHFELNQNLEMLQTVRIVYHENKNGAAGMPILQLLDLDPEDLTAEQAMLYGGLTTERKDRYKKKYATDFYSSQTTGIKVDPNTGQAAIATNGKYPDGTISELEFWQKLPSGFFTEISLSSKVPGFKFYPGTTLAELMYNGVLFSALRMIERERI
jgi:hypothetical protein